MQLYDYSNLAIDTKTGSAFAGISYFPTKKEIIGSGILYTTTIELREQYRPDKIADRLWMAPDLNWVLDILNDCTNGIKEYTSDKTIYYVTIDQLQSIGLI